MDSDSDPKQLYSDTQHNESVRKRLNELIHWMHDHIREENIKEYSNISVHDYIYGGPRLEAYLNSWENHCRELLDKEIARIVSVREKWNTDGDGIGIPGEVSEFRDVLFIIYFIKHIVLVFLSNNFYFSILYIVFDTFMFYLFLYIKHLQELLQHYSWAADKVVSCILYGYIYVVCVIYMEYIQYCTVEVSIYQLIYA